MENPFHFQSNSAINTNGNVRVVRIPPSIRSKRRLLRQYVIQLDLPSYFGWNWDALDECLRDLSWLESDKAVVIVHESIPLEPHSQAQRDYVGLLRDLCSPNSKTKRLTVIFPERCRDAIEQIL